MNHCALVVLAAGLGSRFGGDKQTAFIGKHGEPLMAYTVYDAVRAGFDRIVIILKAEMVPTVRALFGDKIDGAEVFYAVQNYDGFPDGFVLPDGRVKPYGTVHAVLSAKDYIDRPFATVNADDYYGQDAFVQMKRLLTAVRSVSDGCMVPYVLSNTLSENGGVTRGICKIDGDRLVQITETKNIRFDGENIVDGKGNQLNKNAFVSMNFWGFHPEVVSRMQTYFEAFLQDGSDDPLTKECLLPIFVEDCLTSGAMTVTVEPCHDVWFGMTYRADLEDVKNKIGRLVDDGRYPDELF